MSIRWRVRGLPLEGFNRDGGSVSEPFAAIQVGKTHTTIILTKEPYMYEGDEEQSSTLEHNRLEEYEHGE